MGPNGLLRHRRIVHNRSAIWIEERLTWEVEKEHNQRQAAVLTKFGENEDKCVYSKQNESINTI